MSRAKRDFYYMVFITIMVIVLAQLAQANPSPEILRNILRDRIAKAAIENGLDPAIALAIAEVESGMDPRAVGAHGERGIFQLRPEYHNVNGSILDQINAALVYLKEVQKICEPTYGSAWFICYNLGPHYPKRIKYPNLFPYYVKVMSIRNRIAVL